MPGQDKWQSPRLLQAICRKTWAAILGKQCRCGLQIHPGDLRTAEFRASGLHAYSATTFWRRKIATPAASATTSPTAVILALRRTKGGAIPANRT